MSFYLFTDYSYTPLTTSDNENDILRLYLKYTLKHRNDPQCKKKLPQIKKSCCKLITMLQIRNSCCPFRTGDQTSLLKTFLYTFSRSTEINALIFPNKPPSKLKGKHLFELVSIKTLAPLMTEKLTKFS